MLLRVAPLTSKGFTQIVQSGTRDKHKHHISCSEWHRWLALAPQKLLKVAPMTSTSTTKMLRVAPMTTKGFTQIVQSGTHD